MRSFIKLAWRNLWRNKRRTIITVSSICFALLIALMMRGFQLGTYEKMTNDVLKSTTGHVQIHGAGFWDDKTINNTFEDSPEIEKLLQRKEIKNYVPRLESFCLVSSGALTKGAAIIGIDPDKENDASSLAKKVVKGEYISNNDNSVLVPIDMAKYLKVGVGDTVVVFGQGYHGVTAAGKYHVKGIVDFKIPMQNGLVMFLNLPDAQYLFASEGRLTSMSILLKNPDKMLTIESDLQKVLDPEKYEVMNWHILNKVIRQQMESDNVSGAIMLGILYLIVGFGIFGTLLMMTMERRREFAVMIAIGMRKTKIIILLAFETLMMASVGIIVGAIVTLPLVFYFYFNPLLIGGDAAKLYEDMGMEAQMNMSINPDYMLTQAAIVFVLSIIAILVPINFIRKLDINNTLRGR